MQIDPIRRYQAIFHTDKGDFTAELFARQAPVTVNNFVFLAHEGFYDGTTLHRVTRDFMAQGGDPQGTGTGGPGYQFADEPGALALKPTFRTPIWHFWGILPSCTTPDRIRVCSSQRPLWFASRVLGMYGATATILGHTAEKPSSM
jgi:hypothetical protein